MEKIKAAVIGTGGMGHGHAESYQALGERVELAAACDIDGDKAAWFAREFGIPHVYTDYNEMMAKEHLDCVSVTTWNAAHKGAVIAALRGGANVICEKPMAMNAQEAEEMKRAADENGKVLQVGFVRRFGHDADTIRSLTAAGVMGDIYYAKANYLRRDGCPGGWFGDKAYSGGGPLIDLGVHVIDLSRYLAGNPKPVCAYGVTYNNLGCNRAAGGEKSWNPPRDRKNYAYSVEDFASALVTFENGFTLQVEASFNLNIPHDVRTIQLFGTKAGAKIEGSVELYTDMAGMFINAQPQGDTCFGFDQGLRDEIRNFVDASQGLAECRATAEDGLMLMKILDAIYESAHIGRSVEIR